MQIVQACKAILEATLTGATALPGVAATCCPEAWRRDYFGSLFPLHPSGIIPAGPDLASLVAGPGGVALPGQRSP